MSKGGIGAFRVEVEELPDQVEFDFQNGLCCFWIVADEREGVQADLVVAALDCLFKHEGVEIAVEAVVAGADECRVDRAADSRAGDER